MAALRARAHNRAHDRCLLRAEHDHEHEHENEHKNEAHPGVGCNEQATRPIDSNAIHSTISPLS